MQRNNEKTGEGAARQRLSDESDSQDTMLHADEEGAARQSDESDFQETKCRRRRSSSIGRMRATFRKLVALAGYDICGFRYIIRSDIFLDSVRVQQPTEQAPPN